MVDEKGKAKKGQPTPAPPKAKTGALYISLLSAGVILLGYALEALYMWKVTARLGLAVLATAAILFSSGNPKRASVPLGILWIATALTFVY